MHVLVPGKVTELEVGVGDSWVRSSDFPALHAALEGQQQSESLGRLLSGV